MQERTEVPLGRPYAKSRFAGAALALLLLASILAWVPAPTSAAAPVPP